MEARDPALKSVTQDQALTCPRCGSDLSADDQYRRYGVCSGCGHHFPVSARQRIAMLVDPDSFHEFAGNLVSADPLVFTDRVSYRLRLREARQQTGLTEAVVTGTARIMGHQVVLAVMDFRFLGGSMGSVVGERVTTAFERAASKQVPIITIVASGGARMQEGMLSLVQMAKTAAAAKRAHDSHVPYISVLTNPTTGGVYASFANQGDIVLAEPKALIGFAGPRVIEQVSGRDSLPSHSAEFLLAHGFIDHIVERSRLRYTVATILNVVRSRGVQQAETRQLAAPGPAPAASAWEVVQVARHPERPTTLDYIRRISPHFVELHGDHAFGDDRAVVAGLGELAGRGVMFIGQERGHGDASRRGGQALPEGYRKAVRMMDLAARLRLPVITLIDTPGASLGVESEERGLAQALSESLATMSVLPVPVVAAIIGEGGSGGALALGVADRILMQEQAVYSVIAPEGAAAILFRDAARAPEVAESLKITASDCLRLGVIDHVVPEPVHGAHTDPEQAASLLEASLTAALAEISDLPLETLLKRRYRKFRRMGEHETYLRQRLSDAAGDAVARTRRTVRKTISVLPFTSNEPQV